MTEATIGKRLALYSRQRGPTALEGALMRVVCSAESHYGQALWPDARVPRDP